MYSMEDAQVARTIELNDGNQMPVLGLGTWKVASILLLSTLYCKESSQLSSVFLQNQMLCRDVGFRQSILLNGISQTIIHIPPTLLKG